MQRECGAAQGIGEGSDAAGARYGCAAPYEHGLGLRDSLLVACNAVWSVGEGCEAVHRPIQRTESHQHILGLRNGSVCAHCVIRSIGTNREAAGGRVQCAKLREYSVSFFKGGPLSVHREAGQSDELLFMVLAKTAQRYVAEFSVSNLANGAWAFATAAQSDVLFQDLAQAIDRRVTEFKTQELSNAA
eukprot:gnl/TRDRNA2_/TRDRNA2_175518_c0_seq8.p1 gnl/TRDRNA2_/TRDRNA2_175518_c0~~gnl/TRDRNA2_/TRDRNA2_175518_c0_seq8.p1  ORF type:complete len:188 (+),score=26.46 gnl/TRDRNA2_/TRDRNA2_175518_c0_seq8:238-801(+)